MVRASPSSEPEWSVLPAKVVAFLGRESVTPCFRLQLLRQGCLCA
jgi:hypothetical protein